MKKTSILSVINEAINLQNAELNAKIRAALGLPKIRQVLDADIFAQLNIRVRAERPDEDWSAIALTGPSEITIMYARSDGRFDLGRHRYNNPRDNKKRITIDTPGVDLVDLLTNPNHAAKQEMAITPMYGQGQSGLDHGDRLATYTARYDLFKTLKNSANPYGYYAEEIDALKERAEKQSGLKFNPKGPRRVIKEK